MKSILLSIVSIIIFCSVNAQTTFGIQGGINFANAKFVSDGITLSTKSNVGLIGGLVVEMPIGKSLIFRPELNYIQKGLKFSMSESDPTIGYTYSVKFDAKLNYIEMPLHIAYSLPNTKMILGAGPSIGFGLSGKSNAVTTETVTTGSSTTTTTDIQNANVVFDGKANANDDKVHLKALDFGFSLFGGYKITDKFFATAGYNMSFVNISPDDGQEWKNKGFYIKIGYMFSKK